MDLVESNLYEEDFLSSFFDAAKDEISNQTVYPNLKSSTAVDFSPLSLSLLDDDRCSKIGREGEEDEGFEDFVEEEITDALQKDSDPTLADSSTTVGTECKPDPLELFFPMIGSECEDMLVSSKPFAPIPEEILDFDQGVAMESDHPPRHNSVFSDCEVSFDLPFSSPPPTTHSTPFDAAVSTPAQFITPPPPPFHSYSHSTSSTSITPPPMAGINTKRQNSELDLICSVIQSQTEQSHPTYTHSNQYSPSIPIDATTDLLNLLNTSVPEEPFNNFNSFPTSLMLNNEQFKPGSILPTCNNPIQLPVHGISEASHTNMGDHSPKYSESNYSEDIGRRSLTPTPSPLAPTPSPVSSVVTDYSESDYGKDGSCTVSSRLKDSDDNKKIVCMPFYEFKKILDSPSVSERDKEQVKAIRKRGKNKVAAKHCRQRKLEVIMGLQQEVERLKGYKTQLVMKTMSLQRKIEADKRRVHLNFSQNNVTAHQIVH